MKAKCQHCSKLFTDEELLAAHVKAQHDGNFVPHESDIDRAARQSIYQFLMSDGNDKGLRERAKQGNAYRSTEARKEQTIGAKEATLVMMAREIAVDKTEFRRLVATALPDSPMVKLITALPEKTQ